MTKIITVFRRRQDLSRVQFRNYYEGHHVVMALQYVHHFGFHKYLRNHVVASVGAELDFDCLTEFHFKDAEQASQSAGFLQTPEGKMFADDELNFLDMSYHPSIAFIEKVVAGPPRGVDLGLTRKKMLVLKLVGATSGADVARVAEAFATGLAQRHSDELLRVSLDLPAVVPTVVGEIAAVITLWPRQGSLPPSQALQWPHDSADALWLDIESIEATPAQLGLVQSI